MYRLFISLHFYQGSLIPYLIKWGPDVKVALPLQFIFFGIYLAQGFDKARSQVVLVKSCTGCVLHILSTEVLSSGNAAVDRCNCHM